MDLANDHLLQCKRSKICAGQKPREKEQALQGKDRKPSEEMPEIAPRRSKCAPCHEDPAGKRGYDLPEGGQNAWPEFPELYSGNESAEHDSRDQEKLRHGDGIQAGADPLRIRGVSHKTI